MAEIGGNIVTAELGGNQVTGWLGGVQVLGAGAVAGDVFAIANAGISFSVSTTTVSLSISTGTLVGTNFTNGQVLGTIGSSLLRTLTGSVRVPDTDMWSNRNELIPITGISDTQERTATAGVYFYTNVVTSNNGAPVIQFGEPVTTVEIANDSVQFVTETITTSRTSIQQTTITRIVNCNEDSCTGDARTSFAGVDVRTILAPSTVENQIPNRDYLAPFTFVNVSGALATAVFINAAGNIRAIGANGIEVQAAGAFIPTVHLRADGTTINATIGSISGATTPGQNNTLSVTASFEAPPDIGQIEGTTITVSGTIVEFYPLPAVNPPNLTIRITWGTSGMMTLTDTLSISIRIGSATTYRVTVISGTQGATPVFSPVPDFTGSFNDPGFIGRAHVVSATNAGGTDSVSFRVRR